MKHILILLSLVVLVCSLSACETAKGFGKDVEQAGEWVQDKVD